MGNLFNPARPAAPPLPPAPPSNERDLDAELRAQQQAMRERMRRASFQTMNTTFRGLVERAPTDRRKSLLGE